MSISLKGRLNSLSRRVSKLEENELLREPPSLVDRALASVNQIARRLTRKSLRALHGDTAALEEVYREFYASFVREFGYEAMQTLIAEFKRAASAAKAAEIEAGRIESDRLLDKEESSS
jgi:hypothetical protein